MTQLEDHQAPARHPDEEQDASTRPGPPRFAVPSDQDWDGRPFTGREADRPPAIAEADRTQVVPPAPTSAPFAPHYVPPRPTDTPPGATPPGAAPAPHRAPDASTVPGRSTSAAPDPDRTQVVPPAERLAQGAGATTRPEAPSASGQDAERTQHVPQSRIAAAAPASRAHGESTSAAPRPVRDSRVAPPPSPQWTPPSAVPSPSGLQRVPAQQPDIQQPVAGGEHGQGAAAPRRSTDTPSRAEGPGTGAPAATAPHLRSPFPPRGERGPDRPQYPTALRPGPREPARPGAGPPATASSYLPPSPEVEDVEFDDLDVALPSTSSPARPCSEPGPRPAAPALDGLADSARSGPPGGPVNVAGESSVTEEPGAEVVSAEVQRGLLGPGLSRSLVATVREAWPPADAELLDDAVAAGETAHVRALADPRGPVAARAPATAVARTEEATETAVAVERLGDRHEPGRADWAQGGVVIPVLGASAGVGASVVAAALFDALDVCGVPTLLVDAADPARSGLAAAVANQGPPARTLHPKIGIAYARRGGGWVAQLATPPTEVLSPRMVPSPCWWLPDQTAPAATVIDLGWDPWQVAAAPLRGAGAWLEAGHPASPRPVLVVEPNRPSLARANQLLTRLRPWIAAGQVAAPAALVVVSAKRWPKQVTGVAAQALGELMEHAVFLPYDHATAAGGVGPDPVPDRLRAAAAAIPARWGLIPNNLAPGGVLPSLTRLLGGR